MAASPDTMRLGPYAPSANEAAIQLAVPLPKVPQPNNAEIENRVIEATPFTSP